MKRWQAGFLVVALAAIALVAALGPKAPVLHAQQAATYNYGVIQPFTCRVTAQSTVQECRALTAGLKTYVTDIVFSNNVGTAQSLKVVTGTGTTCGTGTADLTHAIQFGAAVGNQVIGPQAIPLQPAAVGLAICVTPSAATSYSATISGFTAP